MIPSTRTPAEPPVGAASPAEAKRERSSPGNAENAQAPRVRLGAGEQLLLDVDETTIPVRPVRCFPWSAPQDQVSLRDGDDREVAFVERLQDLSTESARALTRALRVVGFAFEILRVDRVEEDFELRVWTVHTRQGARRFQTPLDEWPWASPDGGYFVRDLSGDLFRIPRPETLDPASQRRLWAYVG